MSAAKQCSFYRDSVSINIGLGIGYCDLEGSHTICDGDMGYCEKPEVLKNYSMINGKNVTTKTDKAYTPATER